jgi:predicted anti-sigma-YlaC factor YlaD
VTTLDTMTCRALVHAITDYLEGTLPVREQELFEDHLRACQGCRHYLQQIQTTIGALGLLCDDEIPSQQREKLVHLFGDWKLERV